MTLPYDGQKAHPDFVDSDWMPLERNPLHGFFTLTYPSDLALREEARTRFQRAALAAVETGDRFKAQIPDALREQAPELFGE